MPPNDSANLVAVADEEPRDALAALPLSLPLPLSQRVWGLLPCEMRLRCREVCPAWRDALAEPRLWTELDFTAAGGVTPALLLAAAARASGQLERLSLTYTCELQAALQTVVTANAFSLRLLRVLRGDAGYYCMDHAFSNLMRITPQQCVVEADTVATHAGALPILRNEPPYQAVRLQRLDVHADDATATDVAGFAAELAAHPSLREVTLSYAKLNTLAAFDAVVDAALALRLSKLTLHSCDMVTPASAVALQRLLRDGDVLREFSVLTTPADTSWYPFDAPVAAQVANAVRSSHVLTSFTVHHNCLTDDRVAVALLDALIGHTSLTSISLWALGEPLCANGYASAATAGRLLGALVAADSPLRVLKISNNFLSDAGLGPLVSALPRNKHLRELNCFGNEMSDAFAHHRLMPALAANTSLQALYVDSYEAYAFIAARTAAAAHPWGCSDDAL